MAAIAFVAAGSLTVTSCGSDDSNPTTGGDDTPPVETAGKMSWAGTDYGVDTTIVGVFGNSTDGPTVYNVDTDNDGTGDTPSTAWIIGSFVGDDYNSAETLIENILYVPIDGENLVYPNESETVYLVNTSVVVDGSSMIAEDATISGFTMNINVMDADEATMNYDAATTFSSGTANIVFDGPLDGYYYFTAGSGKGVNGVNILGAKVTNTKLNVTNAKTVMLK